MRTMRIDFVESYGTADYCADIHYYHDLGLFSVDYLGDDVLFDTLEEARDFIVECAEREEEEV